MLAALPHCSAVVDEPAHLTAGYLALSSGDYALNREHPPLIKLLAALPLLSHSPVLPPEPAMDRTSEDFEFGYSRAFLYQANDADQLLYNARLPIVGMSVLLAAAVWLWGMRLLGNIPALAALAWVAFEPNLLAHGRLVTTDMGAAFFTLLFFASLERGMEGSHRRWWAALAGVVFGLALLSRYSCVLLAPLAGLSLALEHRRSLRERAGYFLVMFGTGLLVLNLFYLAATGSLGGAPFPLATDAGSDSMRSEPFASMEADPMMRWTPMPVPRPWLAGLDLARWKNLNVEGPGYLNGKLSSDGWWSYFVLALGMKMTLPSIIAALAGIALIVYGLALDNRFRPLLAWVLAPALGLLFLVTALTRAQIGLRYVLPVIPLLCILAAVPIALIPPARKGRLIGGILAAVALNWHVTAAVRIGPHHLAYFNEAAGGPDRGFTHLVDSNLDWGQDLVGVKEFMVREQLDGINLYYFGTADPAYYGIERWVPPRPGYYAVSVTHLAGVYLPNSDYLAPFRTMTPVETIGHSIRVYRIPQVPAFLTTPP